MTYRVGQKVRIIDCLDEEGKKYHGYAHYIGLEAIIDKVKVAPPGTASLPNPYIYNITVIHGESCLDYGPMELESLATPELVDAYMEVFNE